MFGATKPHICFNKKESILNALVCVRVSVWFENLSAVVLFESKT